MMDLNVLCLKHYKNVILDSCHSPKTLKIEEMCTFSVEKCHTFENLNQTETDNMIHI